jgi:hypothetical protein
MKYKLLQNNIYIFFILLMVLFLLSYQFVLADDLATTTDVFIPPPAPVSIYLDIESATSTIYNSAITVSACAPTASSTATVNGYCAIKQSGLSSDWSSFGDAQFLSSINGVANDYPNNLSWGWFSNLDYGQTSLDQHILIPNEHLLLSIGRMPLKIVVSNLTPNIGATTTVSVFQFGFDNSWNGIWLPSASSSVNISGGTQESSSEGNYDILISSSTPLTVFATKDSFINSDSVKISPVDPSVSEASTTSPIIIATDTSGGNYGGGSNNSCTFNTANAIQFLSTKQKQDGSFGPSLYTDWVAIALASGPQSISRDKLVSYIKNTSDSFISATDFERHAIALMSLNINPYSDTSINYIQKIINEFDGTQIGDKNLVNDDVFAIFPLIKAGYFSDDSIIKKIVSFIISKQNTDGSWEGSIDLTSSAIQALSLVPNIDGVSNAIGNARSFLVAHQQDDGGFGSSFSTSWTLQAIASLGESSLSWIKNGKNPQESLCLSQQGDGGLEPVTFDEVTRIWSTSYAIPAILSKPWATILYSFPKQILSQSYTNPHVSSISADSSGTILSISTPQDISTSSSVTKNINTNTSNTNKNPSPPRQNFLGNSNIKGAEFFSTTNNNSQLAAVVEGSNLVSGKVFVYIVVSVLGLLAVVYLIRLKK